MLFLVQTTVVGGPPVVTQVKVNVGGSVIGSSGSETQCFAASRVAGLFHLDG